MSAFVSLTRLLPCFDIQHEVIKQEVTDLNKKNEVIVHQNEDNYKPRFLNGNVCILKIDGKLNLKDLISKQNQLNLLKVKIKNNVEIE